MYIHFVLYIPTQNVIYWKIKLNKCMCYIYTYVHKYKCNNLLVLKVVFLFNIKCLHTKRLLQQSQIPGISGKSTISCGESLRITTTHQPLFILFGLTTKFCDKMYYMPVGFFGCEKKTTLLYINFYSYLYIHK